MKNIKYKYIALSLVMFNVAIIFLSFYSRSFTKPEYVSIIGVSWATMVLLARFELET